MARIRAYTCVHAHARVRVCMTDSTGSKSHRFTSILQINFCAKKI